jgi:hypothetical protein
VRDKVARYQRGITIYTSTTYHTQTPGGPSRVRDSNNTCQSSLSNISAHTRLHWLAARRVLAARARRDCSRRPEDHAPACHVPMLTGISTATEKYLGADASAHSSSQYCSAAVRQRIPQRGLSHRPRLPQTPDHRLLPTAPWHQVEVVVLQHHDQHSALSVQLLRLAINAESFINSKTARRRSPPCPTGYKNMYTQYHR